MRIVYALILLGAVAALPQGTPPPATQSTPKAASGGLNSLFSALPAFIGAADWTNTVADDLVNGTACKDIIYIIARGSQEPGNIGTTCPIQPLSMMD
jgi:hypothetical protein